MQISKHSPLFAHDPAADFSQIRPQLPMMKPVLFSVLCALALAAKSHAYRKRDSFKDFFPDVKEELTNAVNNNCSNLYQLYVHERITLYGQYCVKTFSCKMGVATE